MSFLSKFMPFASLTFMQKVRACLVAPMLAQVVLARYIQAQSIREQQVTGDASAFFVNVLEETAAKEFNKAVYPFLRFILGPKDPRTAAFFDNQ